MICLCKHIAPHLVYKEGNSHLLLFNMRFDLEQDDSTTRRLTWLKTHLERCWQKVEEMLDDEEGNQLLIGYYMEKIERITNVLNHMRYN